MAIDIGRLLAEPVYVLALVVGLMAIKAAVAGAAALAVRLPYPAALKVGGLLCQGGEFAFVILAIAVAHDVVPYMAVQLLVLVVGLSMALTPLATAAANWLARQMEAGSVPEAMSSAGETDGMANHVIVCGFGRVGRTVSRLICDQELDVAVLDLDPRNVAEGRRRGLPIFYGDAGRAEVLRKIGAERAYALVLTVDSHKAAERVLRVCRRHFPETKVFARAHDVAEGRELEENGAVMSVPEALESSLQLGAAVLRTKGLPLEAVENIVTDMRHDLGVGLFNPELEGDAALDLKPEEILPASVESPSESYETSHEEHHQQVEEAALLRMSGKLAKEDRADEEQEQARRA